MGPYKIGSRKGDAYQLIDSVGCLFPSLVSAKHLKLELPFGELEQHLEVDKIIDHSGFRNTRKYLVKWKNPDEDDSWVKPKDFGDQRIVRNYLQSLKNNQSQKGKKRKKR